MKNNQPPERTLPKKENRQFHYNCVQRLKIQSTISLDWIPGLTMTGVRINCKCGTQKKWQEERVNSINGIQ